MIPDHTQPEGFQHSQDVDPAILDTDPQSMSMRERIGALWLSAKEDFARTDMTGKFIISGFVANIGYELFIGNEVIAPLIGGQTLDRGSGLGGVAASAAITSLPVYLQQRAGGWLSRRTAQEFPSVSKEAYDDLDDGSPNTYKSFSDLPHLKRIFYSFVLGSTFNVTREAVVTGDVGDETLVPVSKASAATTATTVAILAASTSVVNQYFHDNEKAQFFIDYGIKNPLFWLGVGAALIAKDSLQAKKRKRQNQKDSSEL